MLVFQSCKLLDYYRYIKVEIDACVVGRRYFLLSCFGAPEKVFKRDHLTVRRAWRVAPSGSMATIFFLEKCHTR